MLPGWETASCLLLPAATEHITPRLLLRSWSPPEPCGDVARPSLRMGPGRREQSHLGGVLCPPDPISGGIAVIYTQCRRGSSHLGVRPVHPGCWDLVGFGGVWALGLQPGRRGSSGQVPMGGFEQGVSQKERDQGQRRVPRGWKEWNWETESRQRADPAQLCPILQARSRAQEAGEQEEQCGGPCKVCVGGTAGRGELAQSIAAGMLGVWVLALDAAPRT